MNIKRIGILTSGGDAPGMNVAVRAIVNAAINKGIEAFGIMDGYKGIFDENFVKLEKKDVDNISDRGGTFLGSARFPEFAQEEVQKKAAEILKKHGIDSLVTIGGDGTYMGAYKLTKLGYPCIGVPATIDNDVVSTEYTIGFDTALNTVVEMIDRMNDTASSHREVMVVEVMGRFNPDLSIRAAISCEADYVITKMEDFDEEKIKAATRKAYEQGKKKALVVICEKILPIQQVADLLAKDGRYLPKCNVLGYAQRGGRPSAFDRVLASRLGAYAVDLLVEGKEGVCVGVKGETLTYMDILEAGNLPKKYPAELIKQFNQIK